MLLISHMNLFPVTNKCHKHLAYVALPAYIHRWIPRTYHLFIWVNCYAGWLPREIAHKWSFLPFAGKIFYRLNRNSQNMFHSMIFDGFCLKWQTKKCCWKEEAQIFLCKSLKEIKTMEKIALNTFCVQASFIDFQTLTGFGYCYCCRAILIFPIN